MNGALLHLSVNHIPVVGFPLCFLVLLAGALRKSRDLVQAGMVGIILIVLVALVAWKSGGPAARTLFQYPGVSVERARIHEHAEAAEYAVIAGGILGALSLFGWWLSRRPEGAPAGLVWVIIFGCLFASVVLARVAHLGGLIRHPEIESGAPNAMMMAPAKPAQ